VHRDLKPDNLMLVSDPEVAGGERIKVLDFGIARITRPEHFGEPSGMTATGMLIGTPSYMAPEQCSSAKTTDDKADVYALGVILYEALGGELPFAPRRSESDKESSAGGDALIEILFHHLHSPPPPLSGKRADLSPPLCELTHRMLAKSPAQRPSMRELSQRLDELARGASERLFGAKEARESGALTPAYEAGSPSAAVGSSLWAQRGVLGWLVAGFLVLGGAGLWTQRRTPPPESERAAASLGVPASPRVADPATSLAPSPPSGPVALVPSSGGAPHGAAQKDAPDISDSPAHEARSRPSAHGGRGKRVSAPRRVLVAGAVRSRLSPIQISERLEQARAALSHGQADETLRLTRELEEAGGRLSATQMQEAQSLRGRAACIAGDAQEASRAHAALVSGFHRGLIESFCAKHQVRCAESRRGALCTTLRQEAAPAAPALPTTLRDPFPGAERGRP
ncbi:MAG TPA: protein kinase, partial [Pseudomonadota bacterium]|nr:protein kinase [Pseudomonadota bacterium]